MEEVLEVYQRPYDGNEVLVCMDETSKQQVKETRVPRPAAPGLSAAYDYEYERNGVSSLFMLFAGSTVPGPTDCQSRHPARRGQCLAESTQPGCDTSGLALHYRGCAHQAKVTLPINTKTLTTSGNANLAKGGEGGRRERARDDAVAAAILAVSVGQRGRAKTNGAGPSHAVVG